MNKKQAEQFETLLDWDREDGRLPKRKKSLVNISFTDTARIIEIQPRSWIMVLDDEEGYPHIIARFKNETLVNLGLAIVEAVAETSKRFSENKD